MNVDELTQVAVEALEDLKAVDVRVINVRGKSNVTDVMVVATGTSARHVKSLAENVVEKVKKNGVKPLGIEDMNGRRMCGEREESKMVRVSVKK